jgi:hypothetical protein
VGVEKGAKGVISADFSRRAEQRFNNLQTKFQAGNGPKGFFNRHRPFTLKTPSGRVNECYRDFSPNTKLSALGLAMTHSFA